jgi:thioredoxin reductase
MTVQPETFDIVVIGAGPAGMAAARAAAGTGLRVALVDLYAQPGGQYAMAASPVFPRLADSAAPAGGREGARLLQGAGVNFAGRAEVFGLEEGFRVGINQGGRARIMRAEAIVVAAGAHEVVHPFPGWTLPGVITAGAAQRLLKGSGVAPGRSVVVAGNGPFLYAVAQSFELADLRLRAIVDTGAGTIKASTALLAFPERWSDAIRLWRDARAVADQVVTGHAVVEALGERQVEAIRIAPIIAGRIERGRSRLIEGVEALCIGHGFAPVIDLTAAMNVRHAYDESLGGWHCVADPLSGATSMPGLFAAGETTGLGGAGPAELSGELAGLGAAAALGKAVSRSAIEALASRLRRARDFSRALAQLWPTPPSLKRLAAPDTCLCRCEDVPRSAVDAALEDGAADLGQAKLWSRAGMGLCQGRFCGTTLRTYVADALGKKPEALGFNPPRFPFRPVSAAIAADWTADAS